MIELNVTLLFQVIGFFVLYLILNTFLYKPVTKLLEERDKNITGAKREVELLEAELQKKLLAYENRLNDTKAKAQEERLRLRQEGLDKERDLLESARKNSLDSIQQAKIKLEKDIQSAITRLKEESKTISKDIAEKILERKVA